MEKSGIGEGNDKEWGGPWSQTGIQPLPWLYPALEHGASCLQSPSMSESCCLTLGSREMSSSNINNEILFKKTKTGVGEGRPKMAEEKYPAHDCHREESR